MSAVVVRLGAWCDLVPMEESTASPGAASFVVHEFADLDDGSRVTLHTDRGFATWTASMHRLRHDPWAGLTAEDVESGVRATVLPDGDRTDDGTADEHPWEWLSWLLRGHGVEAPAEALRGVPYVVEFSERLSRRLDPG